MLINGWIFHQCLYFFLNKTFRWFKYVCNKNVGKSKDHFLFFWSFTKTGWWKVFFIKNGRILGKYTKALKFLLILSALSGHQPTYKNLRGNTDGRHFVVKCGGTTWCETNIVVGSMQKWRFIYIYTDSQFYF